MKFLLNAGRELIGDLQSETAHLRVRGRYAIAFLTYRCTSSCKTCTIWRRENDPGEEMSREQWLLALDRLAAYGIRSFEVFGGDALLRKDVIHDVLRCCRDRGIETFFPTNSNLCDRETVRELIRSGLDTVYLSIDDVAEGHDQVRGVDGTFERVRQALKNFAELRGSAARPRIIVCTTLSNMNFRHFPRLIEFLEHYPVDAVYPRPLGEFSSTNIQRSQLDGLSPEPYFASSDGKTHLMSAAEARELRVLIAEMKRRRGRIYINWRSFYGVGEQTLCRGEYPHRTCHVASTVVTVNPNGDVVPCPFFRRYVLGKLGSARLEDIWGNERHRRFLRAQRRGDLAICRNCNTRPYYPSLSESLRYYARRAMEKMVSMAAN